MTFAKELRATFKNCLWAVQELVYDAKMTEANKIYGAGNKAMVRYLVDEYGKDSAVRRLQKIIERSGRKVDEQHLRYYPSSLEYEWALDELVYSRKEFQAYQLMQSKNDMYDYLKEIYGSGKAALAAISHMAITQRHSCKSVDFKRRWVKQ